MAYTVDVKSNEIVFKERDVAVKVICVIVFLIGVPALLFGLLVLLVDRSPASFFMAGFGLVFTSAGLLMKSLPPKPASLAFNNFTETFTVTEKDGRTASFGFGDIQALSVRHHVDSSGEGRSVSWILYMQKKDGSYWDLFRSSKKTAVEDMLDKVKPHIRLPSENATQGGKAPDFIKVERKPDKTVFMWKDTQTFMNKLAAVLVFAGFCLVLAGFAARHPFAGAAVFLPFACLTLFVCQAFLSQRGKMCMVIVSRDSVQYGYGTPDLRRWKKRYEMPLSRVRKTQFSFQNDMRVPAIVILDEEGAEQIEKIKSGNVELSDVLSLFKTMLKMFTIHLYGLRVVDAMRFEQFLDAALKEYGADVL